MEEPRGSPGAFSLSAACPMRLVIPGRAQRLRPAWADAMTGSGASPQSITLSFSLALDLRFIFSLGVHGFGAWNDAGSQSSAGPLGGAGAPVSFSALPKNRRGAERRQALVRIRRTRGRPRG